MHSTLVFFILAADLLKDLTEAEQVTVSTLGNIFNNSVNPLKSLNDFFERSVAVNIKSGALVPFLGISHTVEMGVPPRVIFIILSNFLIM